MQGNSFPFSIQREHFMLMFRFGDKGKLEDTYLHGIDYSKSISSLLENFFCSKRYWKFGTH